MHHPHDPADHAAQLAVMRRLATHRTVPDCCRRAALEWAWEIISCWRDVDEDPTGNVTVVKVCPAEGWYLRDLYRCVAEKPPA